MISSAKRRNGLPRGISARSSSAVAGDHGQDVIEVARHAARQAAHCLHLLRVGGLLFELAALADVAEHQDRARSCRRRRGRGGAVLDGHFGAAARNEHGVVFVVTTARSRSARASGFSMV